MRWTCYAATQPYGVRRRCSTTRSSPKPTRPLVLTPIGGRTRVSDVNTNEGSPHDAGSSNTLPPREFKREALRLVRSSPNKSIAQIAGELGVSDKTLSLRSWVKQFEIDQSQSGKDSPPRSGRSSESFSFAKR